MAIHIRRIPDTKFNDYHDKILKFDKAFFPGDDPILTGEQLARLHWWIAWNGDKAVGFLCVRDAPVNLAAIVRYGIRPTYRGHGLGRRFLHVAERYARSNNKRGIVTYTIPENARSMNALIAAGYKTYHPKVEFPEDRKFVYWIKH